MNWLRKANITHYNLEKPFNSLQNANSGNY